MLDVSYPNAYKLYYNSRFTANKAASWTYRRLEKNRDNEYTQYDECM